MVKDLGETNEERINRGKDKKISKHYDIFINDTKIKIVKFLIKKKEHLNRKGRIIRLISKYNIDPSERENVRIKIRHNQDQTQ